MAISHEEELVAAQKLGGLIEQAIGIISNNGFIRGNFGAKLGHSYIDLKDHRIPQGQFPRLVGVRNAATQDIELIFDKIRGDYDNLQYIFNHLVGEGNFSLTPYPIPEKEAYCLTVNATDEVYRQFSADILNSLTKVKEIRCSPLGKRLLAAYASAGSNLTHAAIEARKDFRQIHAR